MIRLYQPQDHETIASWYTKWELPITPNSWYTNLSFINEKDSKPESFGCLFQMGTSNMYWIEGLMTNPDSDKETRKENLKELVNFLDNKAKQLGAEIILTSTPRDSLRDLFMEIGLTPAPEKYYHLGRLV